MIKTTPNTCNKQVQKFTNTSYDMLLELYNNTAFFKELYDKVSPGYYLDLSMGLGGWQVTTGTGTLTQVDGYAVSVGGDIYKDQLSIDADENEYINLVFAVESGNGFVGNLLITYDGVTEVLYENIFVAQGGATSASIDLSDFDSHTGLITKINIVLGSSQSDVFRLYKVVVGKALTAINNLGELEAELIDLGARLTIAEQTGINHESRLDALEEKAYAVIDEDTYAPEIERYIITDFNVNGASKKITMQNDTLLLTNDDGTSYLKFDLAELKYTFSGQLILADGTVINSIDDIRAQNGSYNEFRFQRSVSTPSVAITNPTPPGWAIEIPSGTDPVWMITAVKKNGELITNWSAPTKITGSDGEDGNSASSVSVFLTNENYTAPSASDGTNPNLSGSGGEFKLYEGNTEVTEGVVYGGTATKDQLTLTINAITGIYTVSGSSWNSDNVFFDLTATYNGTVYTKRYNIMKARSGGGGTAGAGFFTVSIASNIQTGSTLQTTLNNAIATLAGRAASQGDSLFVTWLNASQGYQYISGTWQLSTWTIDGGIVASGTIAADKLAATALYGKRQLVTSSTHVYVVDPNGVELPSDMLVWYGPTTFTAAQRTRANGVFWIDKSGKYRTYIKSHKNGGNYTPNVATTGVTATPTVINMSVKGILGRNEIRFNLEGLQLYRTPDATVGLSATLTVEIRRTNQLGPLLQTKYFKFSKIGTTPGGKEFWDTANNILLEYTENSAVGFDATDSYAIVLYVSTAVDSGGNEFDTVAPARTYSFSLEQWGDETTS